MLDFRAVYSGKPLVFGHRGSKAYAPMNTLESFELALAQGSHGIELDVHRSKDGYPVIVHDFTVDSTTDGKGFVTDKTLAELKALDAGSWFSEAFRGVKVPTLDEVFELIGKKMIVNVEIKSLFTSETDGVEQVVVDCIRRHSLQDNVIVSSFNPYTLIRFRALMPDCAIGFLYEKNVPMDTHAVLRGHSYEAYHPHHVLIDEALVHMTHQQGRVLNTWTVNDPEDARRLSSWGVDCLITDKPDVILSAIS